MTREMIGLINMRNALPLKEINDARPVTSIPIGGKYRLIDFTLSNMVNSGITSVGLLLPHQSRSIRTTSVPVRNGAWPTRETACSTCRRKTARKVKEISIPITRT